MPVDPPSRASDFDVVVVQGRTDDGAGARVLRARPGRLETGEVRPMEHGRPLVPGAQVVALSPRDGSPHVYDVKVEYEAPGRDSTGPSPAATAHGPAQVASRAYRDSWERTFGPASPPSSKSTN